MSIIAISNVPPQGNNRSTSSIRSWHEAQRTNVSVEASSSTTTQSRFVEIVLNAKASDVSRVAANRNAPVDILRLIYAERGTLEAAKRLAANPATPQDLLLKLINDPTPNFGHPVGVVVERTRRNYAARHKQRGE